jgi:hypothetical protein
VTLHWGSCEPPAEAFFAFFSFSLFDRTSLAEAFLCDIHRIKSSRKEKCKTYTFALSMRHVDYCWTVLLPSDAFIVPSKRSHHEIAVAVFILDIVGKIRSKIHGII